MLVVGAGPAGMSAACAAASAGRRVAVVDDNPTPGGQIWRGGPGQAATGRAGRWFERLDAAGVELIAGVQVVAQSRAGRLLAESDDEALLLDYEKLILATGARERFLPFPGWTLPGVVGAGGLQALVKSGLSVENKRVAVAGSGPHLLPVAAELKRHGAIVLLIAEQAPWTRLARFAVTLLGYPGKLIEGLRYKLDLSGVAYTPGCRPTAADGDDELRKVTFQSSDRTWTESCDYLACAFGFAPNVELPAVFGCRLTNGLVEVDQSQETSVPGVYCAGEPTGVGGLELALVEGEIAGLAVVGREGDAARLLPVREKLKRFAAALDMAFALQDDLRGLATGETIVCRCEDVTRARLERYDSFRAAKLQTRCGMGACQGRVCGTVTEFLFNWRPESGRPPAFPTRLETLAEIDRES